MSRSAAKLFIGYTTLGSKESSTKLANRIISQRLAACVQIDGPISSHYIWEGRVTQDEEYRLTVKFSEKTQESLKQFVVSNHDYECPQWIVVPAVDSHSAYADWVEKSADQVAGEPEESQE